ncbi:hypothetical protein [Virgibacillus pantothenticus]|uniref:Uncharacterized protein n=1 Tax=Virgibacillus pantothenticus TaxID=1473 RepID=A0A0L0QRY3_VIRPA|nr:hypothetical protein [Virgibacillus pantothenticus]KNE21354.1 hypothetical protein AFK71_06700 [Virgibacillus pantothenticus]MED3737750.1 hypothetical protein [Virgibacillus pantothenticus]QTY16225.1 hypothetical protein KBP50_20855 [Virgibacillus pantothenticus]SIS70365.1 hypothetical protein SAMN05421787_102252 [Virgibacillus pantothenticus]
MSLIAKQPYFKMERVVTSLQQEDIKQERMLYLYSNKVITHRREFHIEDVLDFSYREISNQGGILYLHSLQGLYTYTVESSPEEFIQTFRKYFK